MIIPKQIKQKTTHVTKYYAVFRSSDGLFPTRECDRNKIKQAKVYVIMSNVSTNVQKLNRCHLSSHETVTIKLKTYMFVCYK